MSRAHRCLGLGQGDVRMPSRGIKLNRTPDFGSARADDADRESAAAPARRFREPGRCAGLRRPGRNGRELLRRQRQARRRCFRIGSCASRRRSSPGASCRSPLERGARVAVMAETNPDFLRFFFACQYAGLVPVALPASVNLGGHDAYVARLARPARRAAARRSRWRRASSCVSCAKPPKAWTSLSRARPPTFDELPEQNVALRPSGPDRNRLPAIHVGEHELPARRGDHAAARCSATLPASSITASTSSPTTAAFRGCRSTTTWVSSAACWPRWRRSARSTISTRAISRCARGAGWN